MVWHIEALPPSAAVDDRRGANHLRPGRTRDVNRLPCRAPGRHDVLDDEDLFARRKRESTPQHQRAVLPLGEDGPDAKRTTDLLSNHNPAERRREDDLRAEAPHAVGNLRPTRLGMGWMLQDERALQVPWTMQPGGQPEVSLEQGAGLAKAVEDRISSD